MSIEEHLDNFHQFSHKILSGRLTERNYELIAKLIDEFHVICSSMKIIETKQGDFKASIVSCDILLSKLVLDETSV